MSLSSSPILNNAVFTQNIFERLLKFPLVYDTDSVMTNFHIIDRIDRHLEPDQENTVNGILINWNLLSSNDTNFLYNL